MNPHGTEEQESVKPPSQPQLCSNGCGFFANPACSDMCSKCYRDAQTTDAAAKAMASEVAAAAQAAQAQAQAQAAAVKAAAVAPETAAPADPVPAPAPTPTPVPVPVAVPSPPASPAPAAETGPSEAAAAPEDDRPKQKRPNRCFECNKRVGLTGFQCRCGYIYCGSHRLAESHNCTFDYKSVGRQRLATNNPQVIASKVDKI